MYNFILKRIIDIIVSLLFMPFFLILFVIIGFCIFIEDRGDVFYISYRIGKNGKKFKMFKFRSMKMGALDIRKSDGSTFNSEFDDRLTKVGKFIRKTSLDEIPQILNILTGSMSFVGPRPDTPDFLERYTDYQKKKLTVRPGITGYNQAYFRNSNSLNEKFNNDVFYVEKLSLFFDIKIVIKTINSLLKNENVYKKESDVKK